VDHPGYGRRMSLRERALAVRPRANLWWAAMLILLSVVAVMAACFSAWFEWRHIGFTGYFGPGQQTGFNLLLPTLDYSAVASFSTATAEDATMVRFIGIPARIVVAGVLIAALAGLNRSWDLSDSVWPKVLFFLIIAFTVLCSLLLLLWLVTAAGFRDIDFEKIYADSPVRLTKVMPQGLILLTLAVLLQVGAWRVIKAVRLRQR
jgi:hypothetical protein